MYAYVPKFKLIKPFYGILFLGVIDIVYYDYIATVVISLVIVADNVSGNGVNLASWVETHIK